MQLSETNVKENDMKYKVGDKVKIKRDLVVGSIVGGDRYMNRMEALANDHNYILTIKGYNSDYTEYEMLENEYGCRYSWTEEMIEGLVEPTDREKFEGWMRKLAEINGCTDTNVLHAFDRAIYCYTAEKHKEGNYTLEKDIDTLWEYINRPEAKKMTKAEIEAELGYEIEIVEG